MTVRPAGWYPGDATSAADERPAGTVLRWWTGTAWGPDVAELKSRPYPPPWWRRCLPVVAVSEAGTVVLPVLGATGVLPVGW
jgi:hypothetical protein